MTREEVLADFLTIRGVEPEDACLRCGGFGTHLYANTATWRGGAGGSAMTTDVCDKCWGSGRRSRPWPSHRLLGPTQ
jgi:hypothetical protein